MSSINIPLAEKVLRSILTHPDEHDQDSWFELVDFDSIPESEGPFERKELDDEVVETRVVTVKSMLEGSCGTTACVAGWAALHDGWSVQTIRTLDELGREADIEQYALSPSGEQSGTGRSVDFQLQGQMALGLDHYDVNHLFFDASDEMAPVYLFGLIKGIEHPNLIKVADHLRVSYEFMENMLDEYPDYEVGDGDLSPEEFLRVRDEVTSLIHSEYPPYTPQELVSL